MAMNDRIDDALVTLGAQLSDRSLGGLEAHVWAAVRRRQDVPALATLRWAAVSAALGFGVLAGGVSAAADRRPAEIAAFDVHTALAPSSLLDSRS